MIKYCMVEIKRYFLRVIVSKYTHLNSYSMLICTLFVILIQKKYVTKLLNSLQNINI